MCFIFFLFQLSFFSFEVTVRPYYKTFNALDEDSIDTSGLKDCEMFFYVIFFQCTLALSRFLELRCLKIRKKKKKIGDELNAFSGCVM